jgi:hypothetical protein
LTPPLPYPHESRPVPPPRADAGAAAAAPAWRTIGYSRQARPIRVSTHGTGPRRVLWVGRIHGDEPEGLLATAELPAAFLEADLGSAVTLTIVEDLNPDGGEAGARSNVAGVDLNRNFPARNFEPSAATGPHPLSEPESRAFAALLAEVEPHLVVVCHSWNNRHFINYDGPAAALARRFAALSGYPLVPSTSFAATPGSLGSWVGIDRGIPILTIEWLKGKDPREAWAETRAAALAVIAGGDESPPPR